jgi:hypothetical protein
MTFAIIRDLFGETTGRAKIANVVIAINVVTVIAPSAAAALLTLGSWRCQKTYLLGSVFTTTTRALIYGPTGRSRAATAK